MILCWPHPPISLMNHELKIECRQSNEKFDTAVSKIKQNKHTDKNFRKGFLYKCPVWCFMPCECKYKYLQTTE